MKKHKILIADDHAVVRAGLASLIELEEDFSICAQTSNGIEALDLFIKTKPDCAVIDIAMPGMNGLELIKQIQKRKKNFPVLVVSMYDEMVYAPRVMRSGAKGYLMKKESAEKIIEALHRILQGKIYLSLNVSEKLLGQIAESNGNKKTSIDSLSNRELEIFELIGLGYKTGTIAKRLNLSIKTIESYREQIKQKLQIEHSQELLQQAIEWSHRLV